LWMTVCPPVLRVISSAREMASAWVYLWSLARSASGALTSQPPSGLGVTYRSSRLLVAAGVTVTLRGALALRVAVACREVLVLRGAVFHCYGSYAQGPASTISTFRDSWEARGPSCVPV